MQKIMKVIKMKKLKTYLIACNSKWSSQVFTSRIE